MGNAASKYTAQGKLAAELPAVKKMEYNDNWIKVDTSMGVFADEKDKEQFICPSIETPSQLVPALMLPLIWNAVVGSRCVGLKRSIPGP